MLSIRDPRLTAREVQTRKQGEDRDQRRPKRESSRRPCHGHLRDARVDGWEDELAVIIGPSVGSRDTSF